jgi:hypothetical protein
MLKLLGRSNEARVAKVVSLQHGHHFPVSFKSDSMA